MSELQETEIGEKHFYISSPLGSYLLLQKCDCAHPVCSQCVRLGREKDCEYTEKDQRSRTEILEENIAVLQARLQELEHAGAPTSELNYSASLQSALGEDVDMQEHSSPHSLGARFSPGQYLSTHAIPDSPNIALTVA